MKDAVTNKIRLLKHIQPNPDWLKSQRSNLLLEISQSGKKTKLVWSLPGFLVPQFALKPVLVSLVLFCLIFGGGFLTVQAAKGSLPGDLLYPIKIIIEDARIKISSNLVKPKLQAEFVGHRAKELSQIIEEVDNPAEKKEKVIKVVNKLQAQVVSTRAHLDKVKIDKPEKVAEVTDVVSEKLAEAKKVVEESSESLAIILDNKKAGKEIVGQMEVFEIEPIEEEDVISAPVIPVPTINEASENFENIK